MKTIDEWLKENPKPRLDNVLFGRYTVGPDSDPRDIRIKNLEHFNRQRGEFVRWQSNFIHFLRELVGKGENDV